MAGLNKPQLERLSHMLRDRHGLLVAEVREEMSPEGTEQIAQMTERAADEGDRSVADLLADLGAAQISRQIQELRDIESAQQRLSMGEYGICADCAMEIGYLRLQAYPTAKRCIDCQNQREKHYAQTGRASL